MTQKFFRPNFFDFDIFSLFLPFWPKNESPWKKVYTGKNFRFRDFLFKIRSETFWIDSDQKKFRPKFLGVVIFSLLWAFWPKNDRGKNFVQGKNFRFRDFRFKIRFETFWIDSDPKKFSTKILWLSHFSLFWAFWPKNDRVRAKKLHVKNFLISRFSV